MVQTSYIPYAELHGEEARLTDVQLMALFGGSDVPFERDHHGNIILMPPTGGETGIFNGNVGADITYWNRLAKIGYVFDSSTMFKFAGETPSGQLRSPDVAWVKKERYDTLSQKEREGFVPLVPDFVIEIVSPSDSVHYQQAKMEQFMLHGVRLGWLIHRAQHEVYIYRQGQAVEKQSGNLLVLSGEDVLPGFELRLAEMW